MIPFVFLYLFLGGLSGTLAFMLAKLLFPEASARLLGFSALGFLPFALLIPYLYYQIFLRAAAQKDLTYDWATESQVALLPTLAVFALFFGVVVGLAAAAWRRTRLKSSPTRLA